MSHHGCNRQSTSPGRCHRSFGSPGPRRGHGNHGPHREHHHRGGPHFEHHHGHFEHHGYHGHGHFERPSFNHHRHGHGHFGRPSFNQCMFERDQEHHHCERRSRPECNHGPHRSRGHHHGPPPYCSRRFGEHRGESSEHCRFGNDRPRRHSVDVAVTEKETCTQQE